MLIHRMQGVVSVVAGTGVESTVVAAIGMGSKVVAGIGVGSKLVADVVFDELG